MERFRLDFSLKSNRQGFSKVHEVVKRGKRHYIRLPLVYRDSFPQSGLNDFLSHLLSHIPSSSSPTASTPTPSVTIGAASAAAQPARTSATVVPSLEFVTDIARYAPRGSGWTVWLTPELRREFLEKKSTVRSDKNFTHAEFVAVLLALEEEFCVRRSPSLPSGREHCVPSAGSSVSPNVNAEEPTMKDILVKLDESPHKASDGEPLPSYLDASCKDSKSLENRPVTTSGRPSSHPAEPVPVLEPPPYLDSSANLHTESSPAPDCETSSVSSLKDFDLSAFLNTDALCSSPESSTPSSPAMSFTEPSRRRPSYGNNMEVDEPLPSYEWSVSKNDCDAKGGDMPVEKGELDLDTMDFNMMLDDELDSEAWWAEPHLSLTPGNHNISNH
ncbi:hypothetical protein BC832DRAFT_613104 [Gaertneriomyces semiglobifer]|nr:hypothetical protein BC832DRAFT_613104 [Gaertneriomyces semiglobifer]